MITTSETPFLVLTIFTLSVASWYMSRSPVKRYISYPAASPRRARVPRMSSPSQPSSSATGTSSALSSSFTMGNCSCKAGSMGGRWALYCGSISMRTAGLPLSKAQITPSGWKVSTNLMNMLKKPKSALVARPSGALMGWRMAWKARCISELPSMTAMVRRGDCSVLAMGGPLGWVRIIVPPSPATIGPGAHSATNSPAPESGTVPDSGARVVMHNGGASDAEKRSTYEEGIR